MIALGILSLFQVCFVPGFLILKISRWQARSALQSVVYAFALSLIINYCLVYVLTACGFYDSASVYGLMIVEAALGLWLWRTRGFVFRSRGDLSQWARRVFDDFGLRHVPAGLAFGLAIASVYVFARVFYDNFGSIFNQWDDVNSWDFWAEIWASGQVPGGAGLYPQLLPTNWSITYLCIRSTEVKMFAKAIMPLFSIGALLLFADLAGRRKSTDYLLSLTIYACMEYTFIALFIPTGYMETPLAFFGLLSVYALLEISENGPDRGKVLLASLFAGGVGLVKQGGLYFAALAVIWLGVNLYQHRAELVKTGQLWRLATASGAALALALPWYYRWHILTRTGAESSNISYLAALASQRRSLIETAHGAMLKLYTVRGDLGKPFCWFLVLTIAASMFHRTGRKVLIWVLAPLVALWALFFSYEVRTVSQALPAAALCSGLGAGLVLRSVRRFIPFSDRLGRMRAIFYAAGVFLAAAYGLYDGRIRNALTGGWERDGVAEIADIWVEPVALAAVTLCIVGVLAIRRQTRITVNWFYAIGCGLWLWLCTPVPTSAGIVRRQIELQKRVGAPELNSRIFETLNNVGLQGKIATDYWFLGRVPILKQYYLGQWFPDSISAANLASVAGKPGVCYLLVRNDKLDDSARDALAHRLYQTITIEEGYRFIETCPSQRSQENDPAAALTATLELPSREKNGRVGCGVLAFAPDGHDDLVFRLKIAVEPGSPLPAAGITYIELQRKNALGIVHTSNTHFLLGVAQRPGGRLLNEPDGSVKVTIRKDSEFWLYACDDGANRPGTYWARVKIGRDSWVESRPITLR